VNCVVVGGLILIGRRREERSMPNNTADEAALQTVRELEKVRIAAIRENDADTMATILDEKFIYINDSGKIYDRDSYITAVRTHELTYSSDLELTETDDRVDGDLIILVGMMLGHARLDGEQQVYHVRNMRLWRLRGAEWKLMAWQSSVLW
jgi:hypothetical protein